MSDLTLSDLTVNGWIAEDARPATEADLVEVLVNLGGEVLTTEEPEDYLLRPNSRYLVYRLPDNERGNK